jgi:hypothetical protein
MATIKTYGVNETAPDEIPAGCERISLVSDDATGDGYYLVEQADGGGSYFCDIDTYEVKLANWTLQRVLADIPADDSDAFSQAIADTAEK